MTGKEWLAWFVMQPQERCPRCGWWNEVGALAGWQSNCWHASRLASNPTSPSTLETGEG